MSLEAEQLPHYRISAMSFEGTVATVYGLKGYRVLQDVGCVAGECPEFEVRGKVDNAVRAVRAIREAREGARNAYPSGVFTGMLLEALVADRQIPAGNYVIDTHPEPLPIVTYTKLLQQHGGPSAFPCRAFVAKHRQNRDFLKRVKTLNTLWLANGAHDET